MIGLLGVPITSLLGPALRLGSQRADQAADDLGRHDRAHDRTVENSAVTCSWFFNWA
jgi:hypothetical protein